MAITTIGLTGFEHGFIGAGAQNGGGLFDAAPGTGWTASTSSPRNGSYCARLVAPANTATRLVNNIAGAPTKIVMRFGIRLAANPGNTVQLLGSTDGSAGTPFQFGVSSGRWQARIGGNALTATLVDTAWHYFELQIDTVAKTMDWKVDGAAQTKIGPAATVNPPTEIHLGTKNTTEVTYTADYDDVIIGTWTTAATDWYGDGKVLAQRPGADGTHATITSLSPGDAGTAYSGTPTTVYTMVDDPPGTLGWTATRSTTDNIALRTATVGARAEIAPAVTAETGTANAVKAILSYSSSTTTANLAACDVRNSAGTVSELWGLTGGVGKAYNVTANNFKSVIVTVPAAGWTPAEVNAVRFRFGGCTSADINPVPTAQALMLEVDWFVAPIVPTATSVARVSLASGPTPLTRTAHAIKVRARKVSGTGTVLLNASMYEGSSGRGADLATSALSTSFVDYRLALGDAAMSFIGSYSDLELRFWGTSATGDAVAVEVAQIALITPAGAGGPTSNPLAGAVNVAVSDTGSLTVEKPLDGTVNVTVDATGTLTSTPPALPLAGAVNVAVSTTGTLTSRAVLAGAVTVAVTDTGTLTSRAGLVSAGTNVATVTGSPSITVASPLTGAVSVGVSDTGTLTGRATLTGAVNVASSVTGTLTNTPASLPLAGAVSVTTVAGSPAVTVAAPLAAAVNVATAVTGTAVKQNPLTGASDVAVSSTGTLTNTPPGGAPVAGDVVVTTQVTGTLSVTAPLAGAGVTVAVSDTGTLTGRATLAGAVNAAVSDTGTLTSKAALAGAVNVASSVTGNLTNTLPGGAAVAGFVLVAVSVTGTAVKQNPLAAAGNVDTAVTGTAASLRPLTGAVNVGTAVTGTLTVTAPLVGAGVTVAVSDTGTLTGRAVLAGAVAVAASVTGTLTNTPAGGAPVAGDVTIAVSVTGTAVKQNPLTVAVTVDTAVTGTPTVLRPLTAASSVAVSVTGTLTNLPPGANALTGTVNVDTSATGSLLVTKPLAGQVTVAVTLTGAGGSLRALAGQALVGTLVTGSVSARAVLAADVNVTVTTAGQVLVIKPLSGAILTAVTVGTATLTNTGPIVSVSILEASSYAAVGEDARAGSVLTAGNTTAVVERAMGASVPSSGGSVALIE